MLACIHSRKFGAAIVGAAIILGGTSVDCYSQTGSVHLTIVKAGLWLPKTSDSCISMV
jgi:hypothetical protein